MMSPSTQAATEPPSSFAGELGGRHDVGARRISFEADVDPAVPDALRAVGGG
jgi:hypothetical protein